MLRRSRKREHPRLPRPPLHDEKFWNSAPASRPPFYAKTRRNSVPTRFFFMTRSPSGSGVDYLARALRTGVPSSLQMPKPVRAHSREKMGTNQLRKA